MKQVNINVIFRLILQAGINGYQIVKREKNVTSIDDGIIAEIDEKINEFGGRSK